MNDEHGYNTAAVFYHNGFVCRVYYDRVCDSYFGDMTEFPEDMWEYFDYLHANESEELSFRIDHMSNAYDEFISVCDYFVTEFEYPTSNDEDLDELLNSIISKDQFSG